jgi:hypothetical protein
MIKISAFLGARDREPARPETHLQATAGSNDISVLLKSRYRRSLRFGKAVIWRMSVKDARRCSRRRP